MEQLFNINLNKIPISSKKEKINRKKNLELFLDGGFPNRKDENWKFTDLNLIIKKNFKKINNNFDFSFERKIDLINEFEHNNIIMVNGLYQSSDLKFEEKEKVKIESLKSLDESISQSSNNLYCLNKALSIGGFSFTNIQAHKGPKTASVNIIIPTIADGVFFAPIVIKIKPKPI